VGGVKRVTPLPWSGGGAYLGGDQAEVRRGDARGQAEGQQRRALRQAAGEQDEQQGSLQESRESRESTAEIHVCI